MSHVKRRVSACGRVAFVTTLAAMLLAGCGGNVKRQLGLEADAPDEFAVLTAPPLEVPSDLKTLPAPQPGAAPRAQPAPALLAANAVLGGTGATASAPSPLETQVLAQSGADKADPNIRADLNREHAEMVSKSTSFLQDLMGMTADPTNVQVDAAAEAKRLRDNKAAGLPPDTGDIPQIKHGNPGLLSTIF